MMILLLLEVRKHRKRDYDRRKSYTNKLINFKNLKRAQIQWHKNTTKLYFISYQNSLFRVGPLLYMEVCAYNIRGLNSLLSTMQNMPNLQIIFYLTC